MSMWRLWWPRGAKDRKGGRNSFPEIKVAPASAANTVRLSDVNSYFSTSIEDQAWSLFDDFERKAIVRDKNEEPIQVERRFPFASWLYSLARDLAYLKWRESWIANAYLKHS